LRYKFGLVYCLLHHLVSLVWIHKRNGLDGVVSNYFFSFMYGLVWFWGGSQTIGSLTCGSLEEASQRHRSFDGIAGLLLVVASAGGDNLVVGHAKRGCLIASLTPRRVLSCWWPGVITRLLFDCSQRFVALGVAWQPSVQCGTALKDNARQWQPVMT
jgi:hypothetical protein